MRYLFAGCFFVCCVYFPGAQERFSFEHAQMGTLFRITCYADSEQQAARATRMAFTRVDSLNRIFSDYLPDSELSRLSQGAGTSGPRPVSDDLWRVLVFAQELSENSGGAFDISIGALSRLWRRAFRRQEFPPRDKLEKARQSVDFRQIKLFPDDQSVTLKQPGTRLDAGGIAKGYAVDAALQVLRTQGIDRALVDGGGDLAASGPPPGQTGWVISLPDAAGADSLLYLANEALATSGDTYKYLEHEGVRYSHIIDPRSGLGVQTRVMVSVRAGNCMTADALASTLSVLDPQKGEALLDHYPGAAARLVFPGGQADVKYVGPFSKPK